MIRFAAAAALALTLAACDTPRSTHGDDQWEAVNVEVLPVAAGVDTVGRLAYRGGLELRSTNPMFVGLSGIEVLENGRVVAISDEADWIEARLTLDERDYLTGFTDVRAAFMRDEHGRVLTTKSEADSEGLTQMADGRFAVSFERTHLIRIHDLNRDGPFGSAPIGAAFGRRRALAGKRELRSAGGDGQCFAYCGGRRRGAPGRARGA